MDQYVKDFGDGVGCNRKVKKRHNLQYGIYLRGQSDSIGGLRPSIARTQKYGGKQKTFTLDDERNLLHRFRRRSFKYYQRILSDWEAMFLAKHYDMPSRLLDWTGNPLVALYWACERHLDKDGAVWAFARDPIEGPDINVLDYHIIPPYSQGEDYAMNISGVKVIYPFHITERITAQACIFTIQKDPFKELQEYKTETHVTKTGPRVDSKCDILQIRKWIVPKDSKKSLLGKLNDYGINAQSMMPDLEGLAKGLWQIEVMRSGKDV